MSHDARVQICLSVTEGWNAEIRLSIKNTDNYQRMEEIIMKIKMS
jgi:hypothetical protein